MKTGAKGLFAGAAALAVALAAGAAKAGDDDTMGEAGAETAAPATFADEVEKFLIGGTLRLNMRYRFEHVDQDTFREDANASTLRTRLGYETGKLRGFSVYGEGESVIPIGDDRYNSTVNGRTRFPVVADPEDTELNQLYIQYRGDAPGAPLRDAHARVGRQRITYDNHRFIGNVKFRQNEQTYDAARVGTTALPDTELEYVFINKVHRIFSNRSNFGNFPIDGHLLHATYGGLPWGDVTGYGYMLDFERMRDSGLSSATFGLRFKGAHKVDEKVTLLYTAEYAHQWDHGDNPADFGLSYFLLEPGATVFGVTGKVGFEFLEGNGVSAFQTPLATGHAFQGWADQFLTTPANGIEDLYFHLSGKVEKLTLVAVYHDFDAERGGADYGRELDAVARYPLIDHLTLELKYANYFADAFSVDTKKYWASLILTY